MQLPLGTAALLGALEGAAGADLPGGLAGLLLLSRAAVPSCLAVSLTLDHLGVAVTVAALADDAGEMPARSSLAVRLPGGAVLLLQAAAAAALDATRVDLLRLLDLEPTRARLDEHLGRLGGDSRRPGAGRADRADLADTPAPAAPSEGPPGGSLEDLGVVAQALGVLLDRGFLPSDGSEELERLAARLGIAVPTAARALLAGTRRNSGTGTAAGNS